eukprot:CAMPEP_0206525146 /NCGR_PEP_ID=MMETSP0324_2-20121206/68574_1 /ASSEMBLY_ACC=CAM_ASM_000836 /TAXON_ID=2866 /ORGANISM="Crypthecodinium cohnii, Strain Seligo" /LENGTH=395 /DNA_ID=CAMNT_0054019785 /DNA_START=118 /DNA_END=1306 /DNA_ORIENTATION=+
MGRYEDTVPLQGGICKGNYDQGSHTSDTEPFEWEPRPKPINKWLVMAAGIALVVLLLMLIATMHHEDRLSDREDHFHRSILSLPWDASPADIQPNDFWAIHDLLLVGYSAPFMKRDDELAKMPEVVSTNEKASIIEASLISWSCLPAKFEADHFSNKPFLPSALSNEEEAREARNPRIRDRSLLGVCADSDWDRGCSLWASLHSMALRADALGLNALFYRAVMPVLIGGVTMCGGCTLHLLSLHRPIIDAAIFEDLAPLYCANAQCAAAKRHAEEISPCIGRVSMECQQYQPEIADILAFRAYARAVFDDVSQPITHFFVALHNMVTSSIAKDAGGRKHHLYCVKEVLYSLPLNLIEGTGVDRISILKASNASVVGRGIPGLDPHQRLLECDNNP